MVVRDITELKQRETELARERDAAETARLRVEGASSDGTPFQRDADIVLVFAGVKPDVALAEAAGAKLGVRGAIDVDRTMRRKRPGWHP